MALLLQGKHVHPGSDPAGFKASWMVMLGHPKATGDKVAVCPLPHIGATCGWFRMRGMDGQLMGGKDYASLGAAHHKP